MIEPGWLMDESRLIAAQRSLAAAIKATDRPVPCRLPGPNLWLSERRIERREAVKRCAACAVRAECAAIPAAVPLEETWGVFGGRDYAPSREDDLGELVEELRGLRGVIVRGRAGDAARAKRNALLARAAAAGRCRVDDLADAAGLSASGVYRILASSGVVRRRPEPRTADLTANRAERLARRRREVAELVDGPRQLLRLRELGRVRRGAPGDARRAERNRLLGELWSSDPTYWIGDRLAAAAGLSVAPVMKVLRDYRAGVAPTQRRVRMPRERNEELIAQRAGDPRLRRLDELAALRERRRDPVVKAEQADLAASLWVEDPRFWNVERLSLVLKRSQGDLIFCLIRRRMRAARAMQESVQGEAWEGAAS